MTPATGARVLVVDAVARGDTRCLCERLRVLLAGSDAEVVVCEVGALPANAVTVDALARLQLTARRLGRQIRLDGTTRELDRLIAFAGLADVLPGGAGLDG